MSWSTAPQELNIDAHFSKIVEHDVQRMVGMTNYKLQHQGGIKLLPFDETLAQTLPLAKYSGILSRAPSRLPWTTELVTK